jgi:hypothetical protein
MRYTDIRRPGIQISDPFKVFLSMLPPLPIITRQSVGVRYVSIGDSFGAIGKLCLHFPFREQHFIAQVAT